MKDILSEYTENYLDDLQDFFADKLKDWFLDKVINYKETAKKTKEFIKKFSNNLASVLLRKENLENKERDNSDFNDFDKNRVKSLVLEIFEEQKIYENIKSEVKKELIDFQNDNKYNNINILLMGEYYKNVYKFVDTIKKIFNIASDDDTRINLKYKGHSEKDKNVNIMVYNVNDELKDKINCIWYIVKKEIKDINTNQFTSNNKSNKIPIVYIYFKDNVDTKKFNLLSDFNFVTDNLTNCFHLFDSHILDINNMNDESGKTNNNLILNLLEKSFLNILIKDNEINEENKSKEILDLISPRLNFIFGNNLDNLYNLNKQIIPIILKKLLFNNSDIPNHIKKKYSQILKDYQNYLINKRNESFSEFLKKNGNEFIENEDTKDKKEEKFLNKMNKEMIEYLENKNQTNHKKKKKLEDITFCFDNLDEKIKQMFDDFFLKKSSLFINELFINEIKETRINYYNNRIIEFYFHFQKGDFIMITK